MKVEAQNKREKDKERDKNIAILIVLAIIVGLTVWGYRSFTQQTRQINKQTQILQLEKQTVLKNTQRIGQKAILRNDVEIDGGIIQKDSEILVLDIDENLVRSKIRVLSGLRLGIEGWVSCEFVVKMPEGINEKSSKYVTETGKEGVLDGSFFVSIPMGEIDQATAERVGTQGWLVDGGTRVLVIERYYNRTKIKILEGPHQGCEGWVYASSIVSRR